MKFLGPLSRLLQFLGTIFTGWKLARNKQTIKDLKADAATNEGITNAETTDDPAIARKLLDARKSKRNL